MSDRDPQLRPPTSQGSPSRLPGSAFSFAALGAVAAIVTVLLLLAAGPAEARRPGGGHSYSGGHSSSGGGSHSFGGGSTFHSSPSTGSTYHSSGSTYGSRSYGSSGGGSGCGVAGCFVLLVLIIIVVIVIYLIKKRGGGGPPAPPAGPVDPGPPPSRDLDAIRAIDPEFSVVLFEDFAYALYAKAHESRTDRNQLDSLSPYLSEAARAELAARPPVGARVSGVVIGAMRVVALRLPATDGTAAPPSTPPADVRPQIALTLEFESNMTVGAGTGDATQYVRERWSLVRDANVRTKAPEAAAHSFHCPNCGAPFGPEGGDRCQYCGEVVSGGRFDWSVVATQALEIESRPPALTGTVEEVGNDWPTIVHPAAVERMAELTQADPASGEDAIVARLQLIYNELNPAWTALDLTPVRGLVSDGLFDYLQYWIAAYKQQGLRNQLQGMHLTQRQLAKVIRDQHFDAVTLRIWASGRDFTVVDATGEVVGGRQNANRDYSEYWTLIRGAGVRGAPHADKSCPNCGAPLDVSMAGRCTHCDAKITSGEFDWVLSKIEQDESYSG